jgi:hypothetical protein
VEEWLPPFRFSTCEFISIRRSARVTTVATRSRRNCSTSTTTARQCCSSTVTCPKRLNVEIEGQPVSDEIAGGMVILLLIAGIDTTWSAIGSSLWHLSQHPEDHQRLLDDPEVMTFALEEFLRA